MKIFGDDGFRDVFGKGLLSKNFLNYFFEKLNFFLVKNNISKVVIGFDTRDSYKKIIPIILKNLKINGVIDILDKPVPTPCLGYLSQQNQDSFFIMITASHFHKYFNGFKFFYKGKKLSKLYEKKILLSNLIKKSKLHFTKINHSNKYIKYLSFLNNKFNIDNFKKKILVDFSYGAASSFKNDLTFFKDLKCLNYLYNFNNINLKSGSNYLKKNLKKKLYNKHDFAIAFDGDADRAVFFKKGYGIIEPEKMCIIFSIFLNTKTVVGTKITIPDLKKYLNSIKIKYFQTNVGDRNIIEMQNKKSAKIGFETSGHYSFQHYMDGIYAAGLFLKILKKNPKLIDRILNVKFEYDSFILSHKKKIKLEKKFNFSRVDFLKVLVRKSIWSDTNRIYFFYLKKNKKEFFNLLNQIKKLLK